MLLFVAMIATTMLFAQDVIVTTDSKKIEAKILEVSKQQVKYVDFNNQEGPTFVLATDEISSIIFSNGQVKVYEHNTPKSIVVQPEVKNEYISNNIYLYAYQKSYFFPSIINESKKTKLSCDSSVNRRC